MELITGTRVTLNTSPEKVATSLANKLITGTIVDHAVDHSQGKRLMKFDYTVNNPTAAWPLRALWVGPNDVYEGCAVKMVDPNCHECNDSTVRGIVVDGVKRCADCAANKEG
jgi:hypothetical protein